MLTQTNSSTKQRAPETETDSMRDAYFLPFDESKAKSDDDESCNSASDRRSIESFDPEKCLDPAIRYLDPPEGRRPHLIEQFQRCLSVSCKRFSRLIWRFVAFAVLVGYSVYFGFAIEYSVEMATALIVVTCLGVALAVYVYIRDHFGDKIYEKCLKPIETLIDRNWNCIKWLLYPMMMIGLILYLCLDVVKELIQLQSLTGIVVIMIFLYVTSRHPSRIYWRPVIWGFSIQIIMAILVLRWKYGYTAVKWLADVIQAFIEFGFVGEAAVFGDPFLIFHPFAFMGLPLLLYLGAVMSILYYVGLTQLVACKIAWLMQKTMGTTAIETLNAAANIFLDGMDTMLMLRNYLEKLTLSEFNCLMTGNHATVAGFVFALFVLFGAPPQHLLSAAVMSAPATIAICKLNYPETQVSITKEMEDVKLAKGDDVNVFEAAANGVQVAGKTVAAVGGCYIAFLSILAFFNATLSYLGTRVGYPELSFEMICSYVMWPVAFIIGIEYNDCHEAAKLMGIKLFATEFLAYQELGNSEAAGRLSDRSTAIVTYAMCGFSSISTLAIAVGIWFSICPQRVKLMVSMMLRVFIEANLSCYVTACVAGLFYSEELMKKFDSNDPSPTQNLVSWILSLIPGYKELMSIGSS